MASKSVFRFVLNQSRRHDLFKTISRRGSASWAERMTIRGDELLHAAEIVAQQREMKITATYSLGSTAAVACTTLLGSLLAGPVGIFLGATGGGAAAWWATQGKFKSVAQIIREDLTPSQRTELIQHLTNALKDFDMGDVVMMTQLILASNDLQNVVLLGVKTYFEKEMRAQNQNTLTRQSLLTAAELSAKYHFKKTPSYTLVNGVIISSSLMIGAWMAGPVGLVVGSAVGRRIVERFSNGRFEDVLDAVENDLSPEDRQRLINHLNHSAKIRAWVESRKF